MLAERPGVALSEAEWLTTVRAYSGELGLATSVAWQLPEMIGDVVGAYHYGGVNEPIVAALVDVLKASRSALSLADRTPSVGEAALSALPEIRSASEARALAAFFLHLPKLLAMYNSETAPSATSRMPITLPETTLVGKVRPVDFPVRRRRPAGKKPARAAAMSADGLRIIAAESSAVHTVLELELEPDPGAAWALWANVSTCRPHDEGYCFEIKPLGLGGQAKGAWNTLWSRVCAEGVGAAPVGR